MEFPRGLYLNKLISKRQNGLIKIITGIRRCGKSYLLFTLFKNYLLQNGVAPNHILEMAFDSFENEKYCNPKRLYTYIKGHLVDKQPYYLLFDEVQMLGDFEAVLNSFARLKNVDVYVTGSNAKFLSRDIITEFRGRGDEVQLYPLTFAEFMSVYPGNKYDGFKEYILYGGLPPVVLEKTPAEKITLLKSLLAETYLNDIVGRHHVRNKAELEELLNVLASGIGSLTNPKKLADTFKSVKKITISPKTVKSYLDYLSDSFLIHAALRYDIKGKKYIDTPLKYYFTDLGLRNARLNFRQLEENHTLENVIYNELLTRGYNVDVGVVTLSVRDKEGKLVRKQLEVDFVCNQASKRYYIQSAFVLPDTAKLKQEQQSLLKIDDTFKKIIIVKDTPAPWYTEAGVLVLSSYDFLLDVASLEK